MFSRSLVFILAAVAVLSAQGGGAPGGQAATLQAFADKLKLNEKTQIPAVEVIFTDATRAAVPIGQEMAQTRRRLLDAEAAGRPDEIAAASAAYVAAAARMTALETKAYVQVYDLLKPDQQKKTVEAFPLMAGLFQPQARPSRSGRGGGGQ